MTKTRKSRRLAFVVSVLAAVAAARAASVAHTRGSTRPSAARAVTSGAQLVFERNEGQHPSPIGYVARGAGYRISFLDGALALAFATPAGPSRVMLRFGEAPPSGEQASAARINYFSGRDPHAWHADVRTFERVRYRAIHPGIDVVFYGSGCQLEYDVVVAPGRNPRQARFVFDGVDSMRVEAGGGLALPTPRGELRFSKPVAYQEQNGAREPVDVAYRVDDRAVSFDVGPYDSSRPLVIDPVLVFSTYIGGAGNDEVHDTVVDASGATYIVGSTDSADFPVSANPVQATGKGLDAFVAKFARDGSLIYSTYIGGTGADIGNGIDVDAGGAAYVVGGTQSADFPTTAGTIQTTFHGGSDAVVFKLTPSGGRIAYSTYFGGSLFEAERADIAVDRVGVATIAGTTTSSDFPTTAGALARTHPAGPTTGFAAKLNASATALVYSTLLTGESQKANGVRLDSQGRAVIVGEVTGTMTTTTSFGPIANMDAFVMKLNGTGTGVVFSTRFGGDWQDGATGVTLNAADDAPYVTGWTTSSNFPTTAGMFQTQLRGGSDAFVVAVSPTGVRRFETLLGGGSEELGAAIDVTGDRVTVFGRTHSSNFPVRAPLQLHGGNADAFITRMRAGLDILFSTYIGGSLDEIGVNGVVDGAGAATMVGWTQSTNFPTAHAAQPVNRSAPANNTEGFVTRVALTPRGTPGPHDAVIHVASSATLHGAWEKVPDPAAAGGARLHNPDAGAPKLATPLASPSDYFEFTVDGLSGGPYNLWIRGKADNDSYSNDSVYVQFSNAANNGSDADDERLIFQIGTTEAIPVVVEDCTNCGLHGWGWNDGGYGIKAVGPRLYFNQENTTTVRVQRREDGISIDQIVLARDDFSEGPYYVFAPGYQKDDDTLLPAQQPSATNEGDIIIYAGVEAEVHGEWFAEADPFAAGARRVRNRDNGAPKLTAPLAAPANYFDVFFNQAKPGVGYRLWIRGRASADSYTNDSAFVQFDNSVDGSGAPIWRMGTASATTYVLEDCSGCGVQGWGWNDNGYGTGVLGPLVYFDSALGHVRVQTREDGLAIDQIVLSPVRFLNKAPGATKNDTTIVPK